MSGKPVDGRKTRVRIGDREFTGFYSLSFGFAPLPKVVRVSTVDPETGQEIELKRLPAKARKRGKKA